MEDLPNLRSTNIYVLGCTRYAGLFGEFAERFQKYWGSPFFAFISNTDLAHWSNGVIDFLSSIKDDYFILLHEDFYLTEPPKLDLIDLLISEARRRDADRISLMGNHSPERVVPLSAGLYQYTSGQPYQYSFEASIQKKDFLIRYLKRDESPWEAETHRIKEGINGKVFCSARPAIFYGDKLRRGELQEEIINPNIFDNEAS